MITKIQTCNDIAADFLRNCPEMTNYEAWSLAIQLQRNQLLENGLVVSRDDKNPSALEAISIALGMTDSNRDLTVAKSLQGIAVKD